MTCMARPVGMFWNCTFDSETWPSQWLKDDHPGIALRHGTLHEEVSVLERLVVPEEDLQLNFYQLYKCFIVF